MQRHKFILQIKRGGIIARKTGVLQLGAELRRRICRDRNTANAALGIKAMRGCVLARDLQEVSAAGDALLADTGQIASGVFDAYNARQFGQLAHGLRRHIHHRTARDIVNHNRQLAGIMQGFKMCDKAGLRGFVVIGRHHQSRCGSDLFGVGHKPKRLGGIV